jgi:hypothetical protein
LAKLSGEEDRAEQFANQLKRGNPELQEIILGLSEQLWPGFRLLTEKSRAHWLHGVAELHRPALFPDAEGVSANTAIKDFEWIVEYELRIRVFDTFRAIARAGEIAQEIRKDAREWPKNPFFKFLVSPDPKLTFGAMISALEQCHRSAIPIDLDFKKHVEGISRHIFEHVTDLKAVQRFRDPAIHTDRTFRKADALSVARTCTRILDSLILTGS